MSEPRDVVITGIGLVSSLGEGNDVHVQAVSDTGLTHVDTTTFAPYPVHPVAPLELDRQIPKKSDQRQMEPWQRLGVYAAGLALDDAGLKGDAARLDTLQMIVSAGGGERDYAVDGQILEGLRKAEKPGVFLNERLMSDLRPTLFLAQLSNLLAGNISIVHGITGASRTFMGEEQAGVDAVRVAQARIAAGQADAIIVGGAYNAERPDVLLIFEMGRALWKHGFAPVFERSAEGGGFVPGSAAAFLVLEAREVAQARGARAHAMLAPVLSERCPRADGGLEKALASMWSQSGAGRDALVLSGATGVSRITSAERETLDALVVTGSIRCTGDMIGHALEAQFPFGVALAALAVENGLAGEAVVTSVGHKRGEGLARVVRAD